ncbi:uncharacterized protein LOC124154382 [Ischnura elegans]|uniref:uncharacterized protein LOC124154382 n=1 Tax=Ischnura elegans TaxID=197161 RepID=UPI001ED8AF52|nr:uncharacterized protein LOC124154382 [Ischnura elegans]
MASMRHLVIFGAAIALAALALSHQPLLTFVPLEGFFECQRRTLVQRWLMKDCLGKHFSEKAVNATIELYKDSRCPFCKHVCSKQDEIRRCLREAWDVLPLPSNRSLEMVPFVRSLVEESLNTLCENDAASLSVFFDEENRECLTSAWRTCRHHVERYMDLDLIAFCDITDKTELDPFSNQIICQKYKNFFECGEEETRRCSGELKTSVTQIMTIWRNQPFCSK